MGPFFAGPTSDVLGRRMVYLATFGCFTAFSWGVAYAPNYAALVVFRLLGEQRPYVSFPRQSSFLVFNKLVLAELVL